MSRFVTPRRARRARVVGLGLVLGLVLVIAGVGCSERTSVTKAEYRREVNAVCRSARIAITELAPADAANPVALVKSGRRALAAQRVAARELAEIRAPAESERAVRKWLTLVGRALDSIEASLRAQASIDLAAAATANAEGALLVAEADAAARVLGVLQCVTSAPGSPRG